MRKYGLVAVTVFVLAMPSLVAQTTATAPTPIPEEARRHFVIGATLFKDARTPDDYAQVESQFKQAVDLAPQWPDARYNLALSKEAAGDYSGAMADLKLYQQFKLSDAEARTVQDKIYVIEAKQQKAADTANSPAVQLAKLIKTMDGGVWRCVGSTEDVSGAYTSHLVDDAVGHTYIAVSGHTMSHYQFLRGRTDGVLGHVRNIPYDPSATPDWTATIASRKVNAPLPNTSIPLDQYSDEVTISDDGQSITEVSTGSYYSGGHMIDTKTITYVRDR